MENFDISLTTTLCVSTAVIATAILSRSPDYSSSLDDDTDLPSSSSRAKKSSHLYLPSLTTTNNNNNSTRTYTRGRTGSTDEVESSLRNEIVTIVAREKQLRLDLEKERTHVDALSNQLQDLLSSYEQAGDYAPIFGKSKAMVDREHKGFKSSVDAETHSLHLKLADLEHQTLMTTRALEKSKAQTEMATMAANLSTPHTPRTPRTPASSSRTPASSSSLATGGRFTFDEGIAQMDLLRSAISLIRSESLRLDSSSMEKVRAAVSTVRASGDSASILMGRSLSVVKAALTEFCDLDMFTPTNTEWHVSTMDLTRVPARRRAALVESLTLAVAAFDTLVQEEEEGNDDDDAVSGGTIEESVVDGYCLNCTLLATLAEFARLEDGECVKRAREREGQLKKVREFNRRGSTIALQAAGLIPPTPKFNR